MNTLILALVMFSQPLPERSYFTVEVDTNTDVIFFIKGQRIEAGKNYCTEPLTEKLTVELTVRYLDGGEVKTKSFWIDLEPGCKVKFTLTLYANPPLILPC